MSETLGKVMEDLSKDIDVTIAVKPLGNASYVTHLTDYALSVERRKWDSSQVSELAMAVLKNYTFQTKGMVELDVGLLRGTLFTDDLSRVVREVTKEMARLEKVEGRKRVFKIVPVGKKGNGIILDEEMVVSLYQEMSGQGKGKAGHCEELILDEDRDRDSEGE